MQQIVTHKGTQYSVSKLADGQQWLTLGNRLPAQ